jgi:hypothetical protein
MEKTKILNGEIKYYSLHVDKTAVQGEKIGQNF